MDGHVRAAFFKDYFTNLAKRARLLPLQFREVAAMVFYKRHTMNRTPHFVTAWPKKEKRIDLVCLPIAGFSGRPIFNDWKQAEYARILHFVTADMFDLTLDEIFHPPDHMMTFLKRARR